MLPDKVEEVRQGIYDMYAADSNWSNLDRPTLIHEFSDHYELDYIKTYDLIYRFYRPRRGSSDDTLPISNAHIQSLELQLLVPRIATPPSLHKKRRPSVIKLQQNGNDAPRREVEFNKKRQNSI